MDVARAGRADCSYHLTGWARPSRPEPPPGPALCLEGKGAASLWRQRFVSRRFRYLTSARRRPAGGAMGGEACSTNGSSAARRRGCWPRRCGAGPRSVSADPRKTLSDFRTPANEQTAELLIDGWVPPRELEPRRQSPGSTSRVELTTIRAW